MIRLTENLLILPSPEMLKIIKISVTKARKRIKAGLMIEKVLHWSRSYLKFYLG